MPDLTISLTALQAQRMASAFGEYLQLTDAETGLPRPASVLEVEDWLRGGLAKIVRRVESERVRRVAEANAETF